MNKILKDPIAVKGKKNGMYPWDYAAPTKDQAHSGVLSAGDNYGTGHRQPVGSEKVSGVEAGPIPQSSKCWSPNEIFRSEDRKG